MRQICRENWLEVGGTRTPEDMDLEPVPAPATPTNYSSNNTRDACKCKNFIFAWGIDKVHAMRVLCGNGGEGAPLGLAPSLEQLADAEHDHRERQAGIDRVDRLARLGAYATIGQLLAGAVLHRADLGA